MLWSASSTQSKIKAMIHFLASRPGSSCISAETTLDISVLAGTGRSLPSAPPEGSLEDLTPPSLAAAPIGTSPDLAYLHSSSPSPGVLEPSMSSQSVSGAGASLPGNGGGVRRRVTDSSGAWTPPPLVGSYDWAFIVLPFTSFQPQGASAALLSPEAILWSSVQIQVRRSAPWYHLRKNHLCRFT